MKSRRIRCRPEVVSLRQIRFLLKVGMTSHQIRYRPKVVSLRLNHFRPMVA
jgi:hypothetical protein